MWVTENGDLGTADWSSGAAWPGRWASLCLQAARGGWATGGLRLWSVTKAH